MAAARSRPDDDIETAQFGAGVMVLPVAYTKGLEFDAVLDRLSIPIRFATNNYCSINAKLRGL